MAVKMLRYLIQHPARYKEILTIYHFRKEREKRPGICSNNLQAEQYEWCAAKMNLPVEKVKQVVDKWIFKQPLQYLSNCIYENVPRLFDTLEKYNIKKAIYSDYEAGEKLAVLQLKADITIASTDAAINCFKPQPKAIYYICEALNIARSNCLFIGDRYSRDGKCAENAAIPYIILPEDPVFKKKYFVHLEILIEQALGTR